MYLLGGTKCSIVVDLEDSPISSMADFLSRGVDSVKNKRSPFSGSSGGHCLLIMAAGNEARNEKRDVIVDSMQHHLESARGRKQSKEEEYLQN